MISATWKKFLSLAKRDLMRKDDASSRRSLTQVAIFPFSSVSTSDLEKLAVQIVYNGKLRQRGKSDSRYRSYLAGRCAIASLFKENNATHLVLPNPTYGFLQAVSKTGTLVPGCFLNVSHTKEISVAVLSNAPVGIDIEDLNRSAEKVLSRVATEEEISWTKEKPGNDIRLWSAKEAASKAFGLGMKFGLKGFELFPDQNRNLKSAKTNLTTPLKVKEPTLHFEIWENFIVSICGEKESFSTGVQRRVILPSDFKVFG